MLFVVLVSQQLDSRLLDSALVRRQRKTMHFIGFSQFSVSVNRPSHLYFYFSVELVGGLGTNLLNKAAAADFAGLGSASLSSSVGSGLNNSSSGGGGPFLKNSNPFVGGSGTYTFSKHLIHISAPNL